MALDVQELLHEIVSNALQGGDHQSGPGGDNGSSSGGRSGMKGLAAGAGAAALAPLALKGASKLAKGLGVEGLEQAVKSPGDAVGGMASSLGDRLTSRAEGLLKDKVDEAGGAGGIAKEAAKGLLPFGGGDGGGGSKGGVPGVGKGRRMPVQQSVDIGLPVETVYNQFTQFEEWPTFMHRVTNVSQEDDCTVSFSTKIWTRKREFKAKIETQRPDERIKWKVTEGLEHTGVVSFHELGSNLTRVILSFDVQPGGMIEKIARGARHIKRAARADLHRFCALIEMAEQETGAWRGVIEDGELVEEHDPSYDEQRDYSDIEEITDQQDSDEDESDDEDDSDDQDRQEQSERQTQSQRQSRSQRRSGRAQQEDDSPRSRSRRSSQSGNGGERRSASSRSRPSQGGSTRGRSSSQGGSSRSRSSSEGGSSRSRSSQRGSSARSSSGGRSRQSGSSSGNGSSGSGRARSQRSR